GRGALTRQRGRSSFDRDGRRRGPGVRGRGVARLAPAAPVRGGGGPREGRGAAVGLDVGAGVRALRRLQGAYLLARPRPRLRADARLPPPAPGDVRRALLGPRGSAAAAGPRGVERGPGEDRPRRAARLGTGPPRDRPDCGLDRDDRAGPPAALRPVPPDRAPLAP